MNSRSRNRSQTNNSLHKTRRLFLLFSTAITFLIGIRHLFPERGGRGGSIDAFCPFGAVESAWTTLTTGSTLKTVNLFNFAIFSGVATVSILAGRAFCGWLCPLGGLQEFLADLSRRWSGEKNPVRGKQSTARFPTRLPPWADTPARTLKYIILMVILTASLGAVYPPLHELCPVRAVFGFQITTPLLLGVAVTFLLTSLLVERLWCKYLCPLGALLAITNKFSPLHITVDEESCVNCGRGDAECPMDIEDIPHNTNSAECIRCLECMETCAKKETMTLQLG